MSRVYGDSTPFPHDLDYIHLLRDGVDCAVRLLSAQHSIRAAEERGEGAERAMRTEITELNALLERVQNAAARPIVEGMESTVRAATQIAGGARNVVDAAVRDLEAKVQLEVGQAGHIVDKARETAASAVEQFLERHTPPESRACLQLTANPESNVAHVTLVTPYGVSAVFGVAIPLAHVWARPRRVGDLLQPVEIQMPKEAGWLSKRVEMAPLRLERLFISDVTFAGRSGALRLRRGAGIGPGYEMRVELEAGVHLAISPVREDGSIEDQHPLVLQGGDQETMLSLWQRVVESAADLMPLRQRMISAAFNGRPLLELEAPRVVADALISHMAPVVSEISRRSGAPGELVLRRNLGEGRREETYCTHAELLEKILVLPPDMRISFSSLHLAGSLMSAAPPAQLPAPAAARDFVPRPPPHLAYEIDVTEEELLAPGGGIGSGGVGSGNAVGAAAASRPPSVPPPASSPPAA
jgi:hypothetical protein